MNLKMQNNDRRAKWRFEMHRELRYKLLRDDTVFAIGNGTTIDISSRGVAFAAEHRLEPGTLVELSISCPALLHDSCLMRLVVFGRVVRNAGATAACTIDKYEFRTQARSIAPQAGPVRRDAMLMRWADSLKKDPLKQENRMVVAHG
jgi:hypothetical protein